MEDIERSLPFTVDWKVALSKRNYLCFKAASSSTCLVFASIHRFSTLPSKATVRESPPSFLKSTNYESIIVILSVTCIVPKYHIVFCLIVMFLTLNSQFQSSLKLRRRFFIYVLLHSWRLARYHSSMFRSCAL